MTDGRGEGGRQGAGIGAGGAAINLRGSYRVAPGVRGLRPGGPSHVN